MRTFVMGDIHGAHKALQQCLERSGFDKSKDTLIQLGDITDGFDEVYECVEELLTIRKLIPIKGNHDEWFTEFIRTGYHPEEWGHRGVSTARSYLRLIGKENKIISCGEGYKTALNPADIPKRHQQFFRGQRLYYIDPSGNCFVHGGFNRYRSFKEQDPQVYYWDRDLWLAALSYDYIEEQYKGEFEMITGFKEIFIGHSPTINWNTDKPMKAVNIYNLDTGAGWRGRLTIMEVGSKQFWQSDPVKKLYGHRA